MKVLLGMTFKKPKLPNHRSASRNGGHWRVSQVAMDCLTRLASACIAPILIAVILTILTAACASAQLPAPANLSVGPASKDVTPPPGTGAKGIKFFMRAARSSRTTFGIIADNPDFVGVKKTYPWRNIEPAKDSYNFSEIEGDLAYLQKVGKKLWIEIKFTNTTVGTDR